MFIKIILTLESVEESAFLVVSEAAQGSLVWYLKFLVGFKTSGLPLATLDSILTFTDLSDHQKPKLS